jgi:hypothetical protein
MRELCACSVWDEARRKESVRSLNSAAERRPGIQSLDQHGTTQHAFRRVTLYKIRQCVLIGTPVIADQGLEIGIKRFKVDTLSGCTISVLCILTRRCSNSLTCLQ